MTSIPRHIRPGIEQMRPHDDPRDMLLALLDVITEIDARVGKIEQAMPKERPCHAPQD